MQKTVGSPGDIAFPVAPAHKIALELTGTPGLSLGQTCKDLVRMWQILAQIDSYLVKTFFGHSFESFQMYFCN